MGFLLAYTGSQNKVPIEWAFSPFDLNVFPQPGADGGGRFRYLRAWLANSTVNPVGRRLNHREDRP
ncbi:MAG: hypothetical protein MI747_21760, partial [Desulfobacterales bacterium]|nr:hypothetical protein [Desulfobacterales bacterium]